MCLRPRTSPSRTPGAEWGGHWGEAAEVAMTMTKDEAIAWLREVDGELYRTAPGRRGRRAWVAVVKSPASGCSPARRIIALGETVQEATRAAAEQWRAACAPPRRLH